mgnify:CR=1 FL=1
MMKKLIVLFCFYSVSLSSQEMVSDLITNSQLHHVKVKKHNNKSVLSLPFIDDFSSNKFVPKAKIGDPNLSDITFYQFEIGCIVLVCQDIEFTIKV